MLLPSYKSRFWLFALVVAAALIFLFCHERYLSGEDPANFVLAIKYGYSIDQVRPHGPGYPGFYVIWKAMEWATGLGPHAILLVTNALFAMAASILTYTAARRLFDDRVARIASLLVLTNPMLLYFSNTAELYAYDAAFSALLVTMLLGMPRKIEAVFYFGYGLLGAFRLSSVILTLPVAAILLGLRFYQNRDARALFRALIAIALGMMCWLVPFILLEGVEPILVVLSRTATYDTTLAQNLARWIPSTLWMMNLGVILAAVNFRAIARRLRTFDKRYFFLFLLILVPALFFAIRVNEKGYMLLTLAPFSILFARLIAHMARWRTFATAAIALNLLLFFAVPYKAPSVRSALNHANRSVGERWSTALWRSTSFYAPTFAHLRMNDRMMEISKRVLDSVNSGSCVIVDGSAAAWVYPRSLQAEHPEITFLTSRRDDSMSFRLFSADSMSYTFKLSQIPPEAKLYYMTTLDFVDKVGSPPGKYLLRNSPFELYLEPLQSRDSLMHFLSSLFFEGNS